MTVVTSIWGHDISGPTANRPTNMEPGMTYMDTTLNVLYCQTSSGLKSVSGHTSISTVAAAGTNQGTAAALQGGGLNDVTGADGVKGVLLPVNSITDTVFAYNSNQSNVLKVYPSGTNTIVGGGAGASVNVEPGDLGMFVALNGTDWAWDGAGSGDIGPLIADSITGAATPFPIAGLSGTSGGAVTITGGPATAGAGGTVTISGSAGAGGTNAGGNLNLVGGAPVSTGIPGEVQVNGNSILISQTDTITATDASRFVFIATRPMRFKGVSICFTTGSTSGTLQIEKLTGTAAPGGGTNLLTGTVSLAGVANTVASGTPIATVASLTLAAGDRLGIVIAGTMTNLVNCRMNISLAPV